MGRGEGNTGRVMMPAPPVPTARPSSWSSNPCCHASTCSLSSSKVPGYSILVPKSQGNPCPRVPKCSFWCCSICIPTFHHAFSNFARNIGLIMYLSHLPHMARKGFFHRSQDLPSRLTLCHAFPQSDWGSSRYSTSSGLRMSFLLVTLLSLSPPPPPPSGLISTGSDI